MLLSHVGVLFQDFEYNEAHSTGKPVPGHRGKIVTTRQLRAMEEDIWQDLHVGKVLASSTAAFKVFDFKLMSCFFLSRFPHIVLFSNTRAFCSQQSLVT